MIKKILLGILALALLLLIVASLFLPASYHKKMCGTHLQPPYEAPARAVALFERLDFPADLHCDALLWDENLLKRHDYGHVDIPRMLETHMGLQVFSTVNKVPKDLNFKSNTGNSDQLVKLFFVEHPLKPGTWFSPFKRVMVQAEALHRCARKSDGEFRIILSREDLAEYLEDRGNGQKVTAGLLSIEGAQALEGKIENLQTFYEAGVRMIGLTHFFDNRLGGSAHGVERGGLTDFGREVVQAMEEKHIIVDLAHASPALVSDVLDVATRPVVVSHAGVKGTCDNQRNLSDEQLLRIAENGGLVGIAMFEVADCGKDYSATAKAIRYAVDLMGLEHVALGSDFDGAISCHTDVTGLPLLVEALLAEGFSESEIQAIMGGNVRDFLMRVL